MIWLALAILVQTTAVDFPSTQEVYAPPLVRPFEPLSNFGREAAEGDAEDLPYRRVLADAVAVNDYRHSYELSRSDAEVAYDQGVAEAASAHDARMGPLDGAWRVLDPEGREILSLVLSDFGDAKPVEGAWRGFQDTAAPHGVGFVDRVERAPATATLVLDGGGAALLLTREADGGFTGRMKHKGGETPVRMKRR